MMMVKVLMTMILMMKKKFAMFFSTKYCENHNDNSIDGENHNDNNIDDDDDNYDDENDENDENAD